MDMQPIEDYVESSGMEMSFTQLAEIKHSIYGMIARYGDKIADSNMPHDAKVKILEHDLNHSLTKRGALAGLEGADGEILVTELVAALLLAINFPGDSLDQLVAIAKSMQKLLKEEL